MFQQSNVYQQSNPYAQQNMYQYNTDTYLRYNMYPFEPSLWKSKLLPAI